MLRIRSFILCLSLFISAVLQAAPVTQVREYTYSASENDSRVSARKAALEQLQALLIEEVGVQVQSSFSSQERLQGDAFTRAVQSNIQTFAQAVTKTRILEERWDGQLFYVRAEVEIDPDGISRQLAQLTQASGKNTCEARQMQVQTVLKKAPSPDKNLELIALAKSAPIDSDCNQWQYVIAEQLSRSAYPIPEYREFLFAQLGQVKPHELQYLLPVTLKVALGRADFSDTEWQQFGRGLRHVPVARLSAVWSALSAHTATQSPGVSSAAHHHQTPKQLMSQMELLLMLADQQQVGTPPLSRGDLAQALYKAVEFRQPGLANELLEKEYRLIGKPETLVNGVVRSLLRLETPSLKGREGRSLLLLLSRLENLSEVDIAEDRSANSMGSALVWLLDTWDRQRTPEAASAIDMLIGAQGELVSRILRANILNTRQRDLLFIRYEIPLSPACEPEACARQLFSEDDSEAVQASDFLLAYGTRAASQEDKVVRKLQRLISLRSNRTHEIKNNLIQFLTVNPTFQGEALKLLIKGLEDLEYQVPERAAEALLKNFPQSVAVIQMDFEQHSPLVQTRLIEIMGKMPHNPFVLGFLQAVRPQSEHMRFALEDALERQQAQR